MKSFIIILTVLIKMCLFFSGSNCQSQTASGITHSFMVTNTIPAFPSGSVNMIVPSAQVDEWDTLINPITWSFQLGGQQYSKCVVSTNGWVALIPDAIASLPPVFSGNAFPVNQLNNNTTGFPILAPLWDDLSAGLISYVVSSNALWIRWAVKWQKNNTLANTVLFYVKLDGTDNSINYYYSNNAAYLATNPSASIGIAGACQGDFYSVSCSSNNTATIDSLLENTDIGQDSGQSFRPYNCGFTFLSYNLYDDCSGNHPAKFLGTVNSNCLWLMASTYNSFASGTGNCSTADNLDVWFSFFKPAGLTDVYIKTSPAFCESVSGTSIEVYDSCGGTLRGCSTTSLSDPGFAELTVSSNIPETLSVRVTADGDVSGKFQLCVQDLLTASAKEIDKLSPEEFSVFPNPANDKITVKFVTEGDRAYRLTLVDMLGSIIYSATIETNIGDNYENVFDVSTIGKGIYLLSLENKNGKKSKRIIIE